MWNLSGSKKTSIHQDYDWKIRILLEDVESKKF
jgi:hypothetical protein